VATPSELDGFGLRQTKLIGGLTQTQWRNEAGARSTAGRRKCDKASCDSKHPQTSFLHDILLALTAEERGQLHRRRAAHCSRPFSRSIYSTSQLPQRSEELWKTTG
jgi:hypothetical protein